MKLLQFKICYHTSSSRMFENRTKLPCREISVNKISLDVSIINLLHRRRVFFTERIVSFENHGIVGHFLTSSPGSFEALIIRNEVANYLPKLPSGIKEPDEYILNMGKRVAFIIEKKTQEVSGSVDEKIQTAPFKKYALSEKFKKNWSVHYIYCLSDSFRSYRTELEFLKQFQIPVFWGNDSNYHTKIFDFIQKKLTKKQKLS